MIPHEVSYTVTARGLRERCVIGVLCPTPIAARLGLAKPIKVPIGDIKVDWSADVSEGYRTMCELQGAR